MFAFTGSGHNTVNAKGRLVPDFGLLQQYLPNNGLLQCSKKAFDQGAPKATFSALPRLII
jgi:hypothetical protein